MRQDRPQALVPPRPNPGPEPWPGEGGPPPWGLVSALVVGGLGVVLLLGWLLRRRRGGRAVIDGPRGEVEQADDSPRGHLLRLASDARRSLSKRFGPAIWARTTEEIAADAAIREALGIDRFALLLRLLGQADRWKFAPPPRDLLDDTLAGDLPAWEELASSLNGATSARTRTESGRRSG